jgi:crotonobetainyl-CoA:carnitine CoA-transferase CaiB-like acyl-CoA transferase
VLDHGTGMWAAIGVLAALVRRASTGKGGMVDTSLFETALGWWTIFTRATR